MVAGRMTTGERSVAIVASAEPDLEGPHRIAEGIPGGHIAQLLQRSKVRPRLVDGRLRRLVGDDDGVLSLVRGLVPPEVVLRRGLIEGCHVGIVQLETELRGVGIASSSKEGAGVGLLRRLNLRRERRPAVAGGGAEVAVAEETGRGERVGDEADRYDDQTEGDVQPADTWAEQAVGDGRE